MTETDGPIPTPVPPPPEGPAPTRGATSSAVIAIVVTGAIIAVAQVLSVVIETRLSGAALAELASGRARLEGPALVGLMRATLVSQLVVVALVGVAALAGGRAWRSALRLRPPADGLRAFAVPIALTAALLVAINLFASLVLRHDLLADLELYRRALASPARGWAIAAIAAGAPISEELLFRGLLLPALAASRLGFLGGAILSTVAWTVLHISYSWTGLMEVALAGVLLCWAWRRSGSLWVPITCHAAYNGSVLGALMLLGPG